MPNDAYTIEQHDSGWRFVVDERHSATYATREQAVMAAEQELKSRRERVSRDKESELQEGLEDTFPASDPVALQNPVDNTGNPRRDDD